MKETVDTYMEKKYYKKERDVWWYNKTRIPSNLKIRNTGWKFRTSFAFYYRDKELKEWVDIKEGQEAMLNILKFLNKNNIDHKSIKGNALTIYPTDIKKIKKLIDYVVPIISDIPYLEIPNSYGKHTDIKLIPCFATRYDKCITDIGGFVEKTGNILNKFSQKELKNLSHYYRKEDDWDKKIEKTKSLEKRNKPVKVKRKDSLEKRVLLNENDIRKHNIANNELKKILDEHYITRDINKYTAKGLYEILHESPFWYFENSIGWSEYDKNIDPLHISHGLYFRSISTVGKEAKEFHKAVKILKKQPEFKKIKSFVRKAKARHSQTA